MSVIQSKQSELRFLKRQQLQEEARILGNYYRDCIRQFGIDCVYYKLNTSEYNNYKGIIDSNTILKQAYGYNSTPDYTLSTDMVAFPEIDSDIFALNKYGTIPQTDITFIFDSTQFACDMAPLFGQLKEYPIDETEIVCEVPECNDDYEEYPFDVDPETGYPVKHYLSADVFPYDLGGGRVQTYRCGILTGRLRTLISGYVPGVETTVMCDPYEHTDFQIKFPANSDLYHSMSYKIANDDYLETLLMLTYKVTKVVVGEEYVTLDTTGMAQLNNVYFMKNALKKILKFLDYSAITTLRIDDISDIHTANQLIPILQQLASDVGAELVNGSMTFNSLKDQMAKIVDKVARMSLAKPKCKYILNGKLHGSVLFFDLNSLGKYIEQLHPMVGDLVEIDFPDENNREKYEITECFDKNLGQDGINPLLHKYVWKCKARRYVNSYEENVPEIAEADKRIEEKHKFDDVVREEITKKLSIYENNEDAVYGGYEGVVEEYDKQMIDPTKHARLEYLDEGTAIDIIVFESGSRLVTNGYDLIFINSRQEPYYLTMNADAQIVGDTCFEENLRFLKASDSTLVFVDITGQSHVICADESVPEGNIEIDLNSLYDKTTDVGNINQNGDCFYKFKNSRTVLFSTENHLYCKLNSTKEVYRLI